jgi:gas vesicle protein
MLENIVLLLVGASVGAVVGFMSGLNWERNAVTNDMKTLYRDLASEFKEFRDDAKKAIDKFTDGK